MRGPGIADRRGEVIADAALARACRGRSALDRAPVGAGDDEVVDLGRRDAGLLQRVGQGRLGQRQIHVLAEPLLPLTRGPVAGHPPALQELRRRGRPRERCREHGRAGLVGPAEEGRRGIAAVSLIAPAGQPGAHVGQDRQRRAARIERGAKRAHPRADRAQHVEGRCAGLEVERRVDRGGIGLVEVGGIRRREVDGGGSDAGRPAQGGASRLHGHRRRVLVIAGHAPRARARGGAERLADGLPIEPVVRNVAGVGDDAVHARSLGDGGGPRGPHANRGARRSQMARAAPSRRAVRAVPLEPSNSRRVGPLVASQSGRHPTIEEPPVT